MMKRSLVVGLSAVSLLVAQESRGDDLLGQLSTHRGLCDASGAVSLSSEEFAVADDEQNSLFIFRVGRSGPATSTLDVSPFLEVVKERKESAKKQKRAKRREQKKTKEVRVRADEVDVEGGTRIGEVVYWISSHGRKQDGSEAPSRRRLFATKIVKGREASRLVPYGQSYHKLLDDLVSDTRYVSFRLAEAAELAPKDIGGFNIEGLVDTDKQTLLIAFRGPLIEGKALIAELLNPQQVVENGSPAQLGAPRLVDLKGRGIRGITRRGKRYFIVANDAEGDQSRAALFRWDGVSVTAQHLDDIDLRGLNPESVTTITSAQGEERLLIVSDDGTQLVEGSRCKDLKDTTEKSFRSVVVSSYTRSR
jgi:Protein of unknown function (DUF3616)